MSTPQPMPFINLTPALDCLGAEAQMSMDIFSIPCTLICCIIIGILAMNSKNPQGSTSGVGWFLWFLAACCVCSCVSAIIDYMKQKTVHESLKCSNTPAPNGR